MKPSHTGALLAVAMHALAVGGLLTYAPARSALLEAAPIMVDWIAAPKVEPKVEPPTQAPKPRPLTRRPPPVKAPPVLAAAPEAPAPLVTPAPPPPPSEPVAVAPAAAPVAVTAPVAVAPPIFNANYLDNPAPAYPALSRRLGEQGRVVLRVLVSPGGRAEEVQIRNSSGSARLDDSALDTVRRWKFVPARQGPEPVSAWVLIPISFRLEG